MNSKEQTHLLTETKKTLPKEFYLDPEHFKKEMDVFFYNNWLYACRVDKVKNVGDYKVFDVGDQSIIITRSKDDKIQAFHNTCAHRGSILTTESEGCFKGKAVICPYHAWTYKLDGTLNNTPHLVDCDNFKKEDHSLFNIQVEEWQGCVFINLNQDDTQSLQDFLEDQSIVSGMRNWNLKSLKTRYYSKDVIQCNWKLFWDNYAECLHCPGVHPEYCAIVPIYGAGLLDEDTKNLKGKSFEPNNMPAPGMREGLSTWTIDGKSKLPALPDLSDEEKAENFHYFSTKPNFLIEALKECVILMTIIPKEADVTEVVTEILYDANLSEKDDIEVEKINDFIELVMKQDLDICEVNQKGLKSNRFKNGVLTANEYGVYNFHQWIRSEIKAHEKK
jgi:Rieske 2Fe-2S family protein